MESLGEVNLGFIKEENVQESLNVFRKPDNNNEIELEKQRVPAAMCRSMRQSSLDHGTRRKSYRRTIRKALSAVGLIQNQSLQIQLTGILPQELLLRLFDVFDYYRDGKLNQEKWVELLKTRLNQFYNKTPFPQFEERKVDFIENLESVCYCVAGNEDLTFDTFCIVFKTKDVLTKFLRLIDRDLDGVVTVDQIMEFISQLSDARCGSRLTRDNISYLEKLFRQYVGDDKEIKKSDFSEIIQTKNQFFTDRVFDIFDDDGSGSISLQEFLDAMHKFTGENPEDKIQFLFKVYDVDGDGLIQEIELEQVMRACMEENGMKFSDEQIHELTKALFEDADVERQGALTYDALKAQLEKHNGLLENLSISIERWLVPVKPIDSRQKTSFYTKLRSLKPHQLSSKYLKNNYVYVIWLVTFLMTNLILFISRAVLYSRDNACATIWLVLAKSTGQALNFNCSIIVVLMLKQNITFLRSRGASKYLPIDQHIYFHKLTGYMIVSLGIVHSLAHLINIQIRLVQNPTQNGDCTVSVRWNWTFVEYLFIPAATPMYGLINGFAMNTGIILFLILSVMFVCSLPFVRRGGHFQVFYWTHLLYILFWSLLIIHTTKFWIWFLVPGIFFIIEKVLRAFRWRLGRGKTYISSGILLPSKVTHLIIKRPPNFHYYAGDYVFVRIPAIAKYEWHPFTISSGPEQEDAIWLHIRAVGQWTNRLYEYFEQEQHNLNSSFLDLRPKTDTFTKGSQFHHRRNETVRGYLRNPLTSDPASRPQLKSVADSLTSFTPESLHSSSESHSPHALTVTSSENVLETDETSKSGEILLTKINSLPNFTAGSSSNELLKEKLRTRSESDHGSLRSSRSGSQSPFAGNTCERDNSAMRSRRYLRYKPTIIKFKTPNEDDVEEGLRENLLPGTKQTNNSKLSQGITVLSREGQCEVAVSDIGVDKCMGTACVELGTTRISREQLPVGKSLEIFIDGPLGAPSSHIFRAEHAVLIATGIGVTPFASILQSIMRRYWASRNTCPNCNYTWCSELPESVLNLRKVDFFWINRDQRSFEWFVHLLSQLEIEQAELGGAMERFLDMNMYITSALQKTDMKAVGLQLALDLLHEKEKRDLITGLKTRTNAGRPNWSKIFKQLQDQDKGKVTVFYCGPPSLARTLKIKCDEFGFSFRKEIF